MVWHAVGIGVSGQRKGRRRVFISLVRLLLPTIFPPCAPCSSCSRCGWVSLALALALAGTGKGE